MVEMGKSKSLRIIEYQFNEEYTQKYISLVKKFYKSYTGIEFYVKKLRRSLSKLNPFFKRNKIWNYIAFKDDEIIGHISAIIDQRLLDKKIGLIGFFECIDNPEISNLLINKAIDKLKFEDCDILRAPINLTIWDSYRFTINQNNEDIFYFEPLTKGYYPSLFRNNGFYEIENYFSADRTDFNTILDYTLEDYKKLIRAGYKFRVLPKENIQKDLKSIYSLSKNIFKGSKNFVNLSLDEFNYLYLGMEKEFDLNFVEIASDSSGKDVGFCFSLEDPLNLDTIILKTIGVLPEYQGNKIGAGLLYSQHKKAKDLGYKKFIYALIHDDTKIKKLPYPGARIIRNYKTYEKLI